MLTEEVIDTQISVRDGFRRFEADRARKYHGEQIPKLEPNINDDLFNDDVC